MKRLLFFINPNAGHAEIRGTLMEVLEIFSAGGYEVTVHMTTGPRDLTRQIAARGAQYDLIVCTGGDGTLNEAVSGLMALPYEKRPKLGYIPGGTVNDVASTLGLSKDTVRAAQEIMDGHPFPLDIGSFGPDRFFTYVAAFGIFTDVPYETPQEDKRIWGRLAYIMNGAGALGRLKPTHVRVSYDDHQEEADVLVGLVTSTTSVGGFKTTRDLGISLNDGLYEMILVRATKNLAEFNLAATRALRLDFDNDSFISAQTGYNVNKLMQLIRDVDAQNGARVPTGVLNEMLARATARMQPPSDKGRRLKIFYLTQASTRPPTFVAFVNSKQLFHFSYQRYLINQIRENFGLEHTPIRLVIRERGSGEVGAKDV